MPLKDKEKNKEARKRYYQKHKDKEKARIKAWKESHKEEIKAWKESYKKVLRDSWLLFFIKQGLPIPNRQLIHYHHNNSENKLFNIGEFIKDHPRNLENEFLMLTELSKCGFMSNSKHQKLHNRLAKGTL